MREQVYIGLRYASLFGFGDALYAGGAACRASD
jgi:hypothetical protein